MQILLITKWIYFSIVILWFVLALQEYTYFTHRRGAFRWAKFMFIWYDLWVGVYIKREILTWSIYIIPFPMIVGKFTFLRRDR